MPTVSAKQHRFMEAVKHDAAFAKKVGVPQSVGREFADADEAKAKKKRTAAKTLYPNHP